MVRETSFKHFLCNQTTELLLPYRCRMNTITALRGWRVSTLNDAKGAEILCCIRSQINKVCTSVPAVVALALILMIARRERADRIIGRATEASERDDKYQKGFWTQPAPCVSQPGRDRFDHDQTVYAKEAIIGAMEYENDGSC